MADAKPAETQTAPAKRTETLIGLEQGTRTEECTRADCMCHVKGKLPPISTKQRPTKRPSWDDIKSGAYQPAPPARAAK
jgi:hypothetical protein